jgi:type III pantothenate kinase
MQLFIDIGNTRIKWAVAKPSYDNIARPNWLQTGSVSHEQLQKLSHQLLVFFEEEQPSKILFSNVAGESIQQQIEFSLLLIFPEVRMEQFHSISLCAGLTNLYDKVNQLGSDRFASAIAARAFYPQENLIVATCGTATTVDAVNVHGEFLGGMILPGLQTMAQSLAQKTAQLPLVELEGQYQTPFAKQTMSAILSGCIHAQTGAIMSALQSLQEQYSKTPKLILTGGAAPYLLTNLHSQSRFLCEYEENLVLAGLFVVSKYDGSF